MYAVLHSTTYRVRYAEFLKTAFPRIPLLDSSDLFCKLSYYGGELAALHLLESSSLDKHVTSLAGSGTYEVEKVTYSDQTVWIDKARSRGFQGVAEEVWGFRVGGYQVCEKWLKDRQAKGGKNPRPGRILSERDIEHYQRIVVAISETIRLMSEIDRVIEEHGGWPGAFVTQPESVGVARVRGLQPTAPEPETIYKPRPLDSYSIAAEDKPAYRTDAKSESESGRASEADLDTEETMCLVRQTLANGEWERSQAIREIAAELGHSRVGSRIREALDNGIRTAVRRGILQNSGGVLSLRTTQITDYQRAHLKDQFLASLQGSQWRGRDEAITFFARWLGFRRTGEHIRNAARSVINGLIREGRIESQGSEIRRVV